MEKQSLKLKDSALAFLLSFLLSQIAIIIATSVVAIIFKSAGIENYQLFLQNSIGYLILSLVMFGTMICVFLVLNKNKQNQIFKKPTANSTLFYLILAVASFFALYPIVNCFDSLLIKCGIKLGTLTYSLTTKNYFISLLSIVILPAVVEEFIFRGLIFKGLKPYGKTFSIITTALMFAVYHMSLSQTIYPILFGSLLTFVMYKENNLFYCILMHLTNNFLALTISYFNISLVFNSWLYIALAIVLVCIFISLLIVAILKQPSQSKQPFEHDKHIWFAIIAIMFVVWIAVQFYR